MKDVHFVPTEKLRTQIRGW